MEHICENCRYIDREGKMCLDMQTTLPKERTCIMWKVNLKKEIEEIMQEAKECKNGECEIKR